MVNGSIFRFKLQLQIGGDNLIAVKQHLFPALLEKIPRLVVN
jgi:hypothetical protein